MALSGTFQNLKDNNGQPKFQYREKLSFQYDKRRTFTRLVKTGIICDHLASMQQMAVEEIYKEKDQHNHEATGKNKLHKKRRTVRTRKTLSINTYTCACAHTHMHQQNWQEIIHTFQQQLSVNVLNFPTKKHKQTYQIGKQQPSICFL